ncbi:unnamed protein product [Sphagnum troendelagicum]|uniref:Uncharacterized protein n=1 Tax=Sphagnum troendelagicum TaxID=128251 RepID=A0ABP0TGQ4_9BRYO
MEALALLDIDQEDDNLLIASSLEENESNAEEEPLLILSVSPPSPSLVSCKKKRLEALGDLQNCRAGSYIHSARQQRHEISSPEKIEEEPVVLRRNRSRRLMTLRKSLAWDKAFFTDEGEICNYEESNRCGCKNGYLSSTPEFNFISTFCFLYFVSCCFHLSLGPTASLPSISKSFAGTSKDNRDCNLVISSVVHQVHVSSSCDKTLWQSSIDRMDTGNTAGRGPITSAVHSQQHVHTSGKPFALPKRPRGLPTVPAVKDPIKRVDSSAAFGSDTTIKGVFNVRNLFHAKDTSSATCTASKMQVPSIPRSKSATPPPGLVKCLPGSIQDAMLPPAEAFHTGKPSGLRKPSPKLGFFDSVPNHSSIGMHSRIPSKDTGGSNSRLQGLFLGKGRSPISYAPHLQSDVASVPATPRACLTSPATPQGSSSKSTRLPVRKGLPGYKNCSGSVCRELMSETPQLNGKRPQSDISDSKTVNMAMQATDSSLKLPNAQFNKLDRPDFESANDILCLPEPHHAQASALCAECDAKCLQCRFIPETEGVDCGSVQTIFSLQLPEGDVTLSGDHGADSKKKALAARYCVQDSDRETEGGDCSSVQTTFSLQLPEGDITPSGDHGADSNEEALAASYCVQDSDHELKIEGGDCDSVQTIFSLQLPEGDITASGDCGADSNKEALASSYCVQDSDHELETWGSDCGSVQTAFNLRLPEGEITQRVVHGAFSNKEISYCVQDSDHELETDEGDCGSVKMDFSISLSKRDVSPRGDYGDDPNEDVLANYPVQDPNHELETEGGDCGNVKTIFRLSLSEGDISQRGDHGANSNKDDLAASFCAKDSDNELETDEGDCVNVKTGFSLSLSEEDISGRCDHGTDSMKAALAASYCVPDLNHELETEGGDGSNVRTVFPLTFSEDDISPRGDYGTESNKEILTAGDCVKDSDCEPSGGQSNSCGAVLMLPISLSSGNIASAQNCGSEQVETSGSSRHALQKQALAWMARSDCLQGSESIQSVLLLSPHDNLLEAPTEPGSASAVEARESSLLQVSMKTTDLSELLEFSAIILCTQISGDDKDQTEETEVTSLPNSKPPSPFSEERICALEAEGKESLQVKSGPVKHSPPEKIDPEPNPWSPVRKNGRQLGPFDCTKLKYINPGLPT